MTHRHDRRVASGFSAVTVTFLHLQGYNVLHPIGWDAFGLPAEQYAIQTGTHPRVTTEANINRFRQQLQSLGKLHLKPGPIS